MKRRPNPKKALASTRRIGFALILSVLTWSGLVAVVGLATAAPQPTDVPDRFGVPFPNVGDRGEYFVSIGNRTNHEFVVRVPEEPAIRFEWLAPMDVLDCKGNPRRVNLMQFAYRPLFKDDHGPVGVVADPSRSLDTQWANPLIAEFDATNGERTGWIRIDPDPSILAVRDLRNPTEAWSELGGLRTRGFGTPCSSGGQFLPCGLQHELRGRTMDMGQPVLLFQKCHLGTSYTMWRDGLKFRAVGTEEQLGERCVVFLNEPHLNLVKWAANRVQFNSEDREKSEYVHVYVWLCPSHPYPTRMAVEDAYNPDVYAVYRLANLARGLEPVAAPGDAPSLPPAPPVTFATRPPWILDDNGTDHPFPLSAAYAYALSEPSSSGLRAFVGAKPDAYVERAEYVETRNDTRVHRAWSFVVTDGQGRISIGVHQETALNQHPTAVPSYHYSNASEHRWPLADLPVPPSLLPKTLPTVASLQGWWKAFVVPRVPQHGANAWSFEVGFVEEMCQFPTDPRYRASACTEAAVYVDIDVGHQLLERKSAPIHGGATSTDEERINLLNLGHRRGATHARGEFQSYQPNASSPFVSSSLDHEPAPPMGFDLALWYFPEPPAVVGVSLVAIAVGFVYWSWPGLKGLVAFPFYSRLERDAALNHPRRAELATLIEEEPGIHFQGIVRRLGLPRGTTKHHLRKLVQVGLIAEQAAGGYHCYFPRGVVDRRLMAAAPVLKAPGARAALAAVATHAGASSIQIARATNLDPATVSYHVRRLQEAGLIRTERHGRELRLWITEWGQAALKSLPAQ